ncbi:MAG: acyl-CoA dehydrogenase [Acidimicrobiia bacterium]|nr:acyl-CoA dehydrogenase [Acidimicrobiia bacterium]
MDTRDTPEQAELRRAARQLARELGPSTVADLDDATRSKRLGAAVRDAGWLELRHDDGEGNPVASGVEAVIVADALGGSVADVAFSGPVLAADLARRAGIEHTEDAVVVFSPNLIDAAADGGIAVDVDTEHAETAYVLVPTEGGSHLAEVGLNGIAEGTDLTRRISNVPAGAPVVDIGGARLLTHDDLVEWTALGLALTSADLVGVMRGVLDVTVAYASEREQFGVAVGSFQAVQHLLADARCLMEGSLSVALHASWAVDELAPDEALAAGRVAKAYCARAARTVCENAVQVHGGIGNTWDCVVNVYLRRALLSSQWFGDDGVQLNELQRTRLGADDGLS